jgi:NitT/TauT family transport system substrate-binding protein
VKASPISTRGSAHVPAAQGGVFVALRPFARRVVRQLRVAPRSVLDGGSWFPSLFRHPSLHRVEPCCGRLLRWAPLCAILTLAALMTSCNRTSSPAAAPGLTKVTLQADWYPQPEHGGFYTALVKGYYQGEGLDVTIQPGSQYLIPDQQVAVGAAQFGMGSSDRTLESVADGHPLVAVAATMQNDPQGIMVRKDSPVRSFNDLHGHTIAVKPGSTWFQYLAKRFELTDVHEIPATMSVANFVADPQYIQQAFATSEPFFAHKAGIETRVLLTSGAGYNPYRVMFTTRDFLRQHPQTVAKFVRASLRGWREYLLDPAAAHGAIAKLNPALSADWMQFSWETLRDGRFVAGGDLGGRQLGQMESARWTTMYNQLLELKVIDKPFDAASAYTLEFLEHN